MLPKFDDSGWRRVNVPHDWSIEGPFSAEFGAGNGFAPGGIAWYRKHFRMDPTDEGKRVTLEMDGVYDHAEVWLNGFLVGGRPYGYESFTCELTPLLKFGDDENVLAVRVDHSRIGDSRWYTGAGIYRNVRLCVTDPLHIAHWGTYVTTPDLKENSATVRVETAIENQSGASQSFSLVSDLLDPDGHVLATASTPGALDQGGSRAMVQELTLARPQRWSPDSPSPLHPSQPPERRREAGRRGTDAIRRAHARGQSRSGLLPERRRDETQGRVHSQDGRSVGIASDTRPCGTDGLGTGKRLWA